jgi:beta-phosphoglucomutase-like phosphatase (HAD superfamily)
MHTPDLSHFKALLFDLDGVVTRTATIHAAAWKQLVDDFLERRARDEGTSYEPFDVVSDYVRYVDGRQRYDGIDGLLRARGIELPWGNPSDPAGVESVCALGNAKNRHFQEQLERQPVDVSMTPSR